MSDIRTVSGLSTFLDDELAWRTKELHEIWSHIYFVRHTVKAKAFIRCGVAVLYAHWEGFIKAAGEAYLQFIAAQRLRHSELKTNFVALCARRLFNEASQSTKAEFHVKLARFFLEGGNEQSSLRWRGAIPTKANLNSTALRQIIISFGFDYSLYETKEKLLDERLLKTRNTIAHGGYIVVDMDDFEELHREVLGLMRLFANQIDNAARLEEFRRPVPLPSGIATTAARPTGSLSE